MGIDTVSSVCILGSEARESDMTDPFTLAQAHEIIPNGDLLDQEDIDRANAMLSEAPRLVVWMRLWGWAADMAHVSFMETREAARFEQNYR